MQYVTVFVVMWALHNAAGLFGGACVAGKTQSTRSTCRVRSERSLDGHFNVLYTTSVQLLQTQICQGHVSHDVHVFLQHRMLRGTAQLVR